MCPNLTTLLLHPDYLTPTLHGIILRLLLFLMTPTSMLFATLSPSLPPIFPPLLAISTLLLLPPMARMFSFLTPVEAVSLLLLVEPLTSLIDMLINPLFLVISLEILPLSVLLSMVLPKYNYPIVIPLSFLS